MNIAHIADLQVKNREKNLFIPYQDGLQNIIKSLDEDIECVVIAGDLFEYAEPNDSERKLIYEFLSNLAKKPTIKEIVLMAGNHDLVKLKKSQITNEGIDEDINEKGNAINLFVELINSLQTEFKDKFIYINQSKIYHSKIDENVNYIGYCLEDGMKVDMTGYDASKKNICIFHAMLREYAEQEKIPLRQDIIKSLKDLSIFPKDSVVMAGDIHLRLTYKSNGVIFHYPGSTQQHTHNEGDYIEFIHNKRDDEWDIKINYGEDKSYTKWNTNNLLSQEYHGLIDYVRYQTFIIPKDIPAPEIFPLIRDSIIREGVDVTYIKVKCPNSFNVYESKLRNLFNEKYNGKAIVEFTYDKVSKEVNEVESGVVREIIDEVIDANTDKEDPDKPFIIDPSNIDNLLLTEDQLKRMFEYVVNVQLDKADIDYTVSPDIRRDLNALFGEQIQNVLSKGRRFSVKLKKIACNQFMALGKNKIDLSKEGIVRILGTNGIGKTTLFRMIRWVLTGTIYEGMKSNTTVLNNSKVFNRNLPYDDFVQVNLSLYNNDTPIIIKRRVTRNWKNTAGLAQKTSKNWIDYASLKSELEVVIHPNEENEKTLVGDNAQANINAWFGNVINTIMFINQMKIEEILKSKTLDINDMILSFIGVDYLQSLEKNLEVVHDELLSMGRPSRTVELVNKDMLAKNNLIKINEEELDNVNNSIDSINIDIQCAKNNLANTNTKLINIGDVEKQINEEEEQKKVVDARISIFVEKEYKTKKDWNREKPVLDQDSVNKVESNIKTKEQDVETKRSETNTLRTKNDNYRGWLMNESNEIDSKLKKLIDDKESEMKQSQEVIYQTITNIGNNIQEKIDNSQEQINNLVSKKSKVENRINVIDTTVSDNKKKIESGVCTACGRPFDEHYDEMKKNLTMENERLETEKKQAQEEKEGIQKNIDSINLVIEKGYKPMKIASTEIKSMDKCDAFIERYQSKTVWSIVSNDVFSIKKRIEENERTSKEITVFKQQQQRYKNILLLLTPLDGVNTIEFEFLTAKHIEIINSYHSNKQNIDKYDDEISEINAEITTLKDNLKKIREDYDKEVRKYQEDYERHVKENDEIDEYNRSVDKEKLSYRDDVILSENIQKRIDVLTAKLPEFKALIQDKENYSREIDKNENLLKEKRASVEKLKLDIQSKQSDITALKKELDSIIQYKKNDITYRIYSKLIKGAFKSIVFEYYRTFLNNTLDVLLNEVDFKLFWDSNSQLMMVTCVNGVTSYIPVTEASGMETIFTGLALIYTISLLNVKNTCSHIFIDELSGQLSTGKNLHFNREYIKNYQDLFVRILNKFNEKTIFIVDHNIDNIGESFCYEVVKGENGNTYVEI